MRTSESAALRRSTGALLVIAVAGFTVAASVLSATFDWPEIVREDAATVLARAEAGGPRVVWAWFATAWAYGVLVAPVVLLPAALGRRHDPWLHVATVLGAASVAVSVIGFLRWVFVVPPLAAAYDDADPVQRAAVEAAWTAQHQLGGALLGEHLGQVLAVAWSVAVCVVVIRTRVLPRSLGWAGLVASAVYLLNQGDVLATAVPGFPVWDLAGVLGSTLWGAWVLALGVALLVSAARAGSRPPGATSSAPRGA